MVFTAALGRCVQIPCICPIDRDKIEVAVDHVNRNERAAAAGRLKIVPARPLSDSAEGLSEGHGEGKVEKEQLYNCAEVYFEQDWFYITETKPKVKTIAEVLQQQVLPKPVLFCVFNVFL